MKRTLIVLLCVFATCMALTACSGSTTPKEIRINSYPKQFYFIGSTEAEFKESLGDAYVTIRYVNNTESKPIPLNDSRFTVSGFSAATVGSKDITILYSKYNLKATFVVTIEPIEAASFEITKKPDKIRYFADVEISKNEIEFDGGEIVITNNDDTFTAPVPMTTNNVKANSIIFLSENGGKDLYGEIVVQLLGTNCIEKFRVEVDALYPVSYTITKIPTYRLYDASAQPRDIKTNGLEFEVTKNSGKKYTTTDLNALGISVNFVDYENAKIGLISSKIDDEINCLAEFDMIPLGKDCLAADYYKGLDWTNRLELSAQKMAFLDEAFTILSSSAATEIEALPINNYKNNIAVLSFYFARFDVLGKKMNIESGNIEYMSEYNKMLIAATAYENALAAYDNDKTNTEKKDDYNKALTDLQNAAKAYKISASVGEVYLTYCNEFLTLYTNLDSYSNFAAIELYSENETAVTVGDLVDSFKTMKTICTFVKNAVA